MVTKSVHSGVPILALLAGATMWGVVWYPMRLLESAGLSGAWLTLLLYSASSVVGAVLAWQYLAWVRRRPIVLLTLALSAGWTNLAFILAVLDGNVMRVLLLFYLSPVWAVVLGWLFLKERISRITLAILVVALAGAVMMLWQRGTPWPWPSGSSDWLALTSGFAFAASNILVRYGEEVPVQVKGLASWAGVSALAGILVVFTRSSAPEFTANMIVGVIALAVFGMVVMTLLVQYGVSNMPVHRSAIILLFELVAGAVSQQLLTDEVMTPLEWGGGILVIAAAGMMAVRQKHPT
jgi:drug/metabolite transporter (DMT)-like permease